MKTVSLVVERTVEEHYTLTLDPKLGSRVLSAAVQDKQEMGRYRTYSKEISVKVVGQREVPYLFRRKKK